MKVTIDVHDLDLIDLMHWASVSRTLNEAKRLLDLYAAISDHVEAEEIQNNIEELKTLEPILNRLHQTVRNELWNQNRGISPTETFTFVIRDHYNILHPTKVIDIFDRKNKFVACLYPKDDGVKVLSKHFHEVNANPMPFGSVEVNMTFNEDLWEPNVEVNENGSKS